MKFKEFLVLYFFYLIFVIKSVPGELRFVWGCSGDFRECSGPVPGFTDTTCFFRENVFLTRLRFKYICLSQACHFGTNQVHVGGS